MWHHGEAFECVCWVVTAVVCGCGCAGLGVPLFGACDKGKFTARKKEENVTGSDFTPHTNAAQML